MRRSFLFKKERAKNIIHINEAEYIFEIKLDVVEKLTEYTQHKGDELCGVLTGSKIDNSKYRICKISQPCIAKNSLFRCERDAEEANTFINEDFLKSNNTRVYIGEWHTHAQDIPTPSSVDYNSIIQIYNTSEIPLPFLLLIIVGKSEIYYCLYDGERFIKFTPILYNS